MTSNTPKNVPLLLNSNFLEPDISAEKQIGINKEAGKNSKLKETFISKHAKPKSFIKKLFKSKRGEKYFNQDCTERSVDLIGKFEPQKIPIDNGKLPESCSQERKLHKNLDFTSVR